MNRQVKTLKSWSIVLLACISLFNCTALAKYSGGSGASGDPYQIANVADLMTLANDANDYNKCFIMTADIDLDPNLPGNQVFTKAIIAMDINNSNQIFDGKTFEGTFNGNGFEIQNLTINTNGTSSRFLGLFGDINSSAGQVKNLGIVNAFIKGGPGSYYFGAICGENRFSTIINCYATGQVTGGTDSHYSGGLCGYNRNGTINNCYATGQVAGGTDSFYSGGLCGYNYNGTISNCYATGFISGGKCFGGVFGGNSGTISNCRADCQIIGGSDSYYLGGLCGINSGTISNCNSVGSVSGHHDLGGLSGGNFGTISNCYVSGSVAGVYELGGLCGRNFDTISGCYTTGSVSGNSELGGVCGLNDSGTIRNCYATGPVDGNYNPGGLCGMNYYYGIISNCYAFGQITSLNGGGLCGINVGTINNCYFYLFSGPDNHLGIALEAEQMIEQDSFTGFDFTGNPDDGTEDIWAITTGHCPKLSWQTDDGPLQPGYVPDTNLSGTGYDDDPFQINNEADFNEFMTNNQLNCGYYLLTCDIDMTGQSFTTAVIDRFFSGHLDGGDHKISNITIDTLTADTSYLGIFSTVCGSISNLGIENISLAGGISSDYLGGLCGYNSGTITSCYATGSVYGDDILGGLCGSNLGTISNCYVISSVSGDGFLGGLCGTNSGTISNCYASGSVSGDVELGGLCGENSGIIIKSYAIGSVSGYLYFGGLCGKNSSTISSCYAAGPVNGVSDSKYIGGLCGLNYGTLSNCYSVGQITSGTDSNNLGGLCGTNSGTISNCYSMGIIASGNNSNNLGGLVGWSNNSSINNCYFLDIAGPNNGYGTTLSDEEMKQRSSFVDWDFVDETADGCKNFWRLCNEGMEYPKMAWQYLAGDITCPDGVDTFDLAEFCEQWLLKELPADVAPQGGDGMVDFTDFAVFADQWGITNDIVQLFDFTKQWMKIGQVTSADISPPPYGDGRVNEADFALMAENWRQ